MKLLCPIYFKLISYYVFDYVQELIEDYWETEKQITMLIVFKLLRKWNISLLPGKKPLRQWVNSNYFGLIWRIKCLVFVKMPKKFGLLTSHDMLIIYIKPIVVWKYNKSNIGHCWPFCFSIECWQLTKVFPSVEFIMLYDLSLHMKVCITSDVVFYWCQSSNTTIVRRRMCMQKGPDTRL